MVKIIERRIFEGTNKKINQCPSCGGKIDYDKNSINFASDMCTIDGECDSCGGKRTAIYKFQEVEED